MVATMRTLAARRAHTAGQGTAHRSKLAVGCCSLALDTMPGQVAEASAEPLEPCLKSLYGEGVEDGVFQLTQNYTPIFPNDRGRHKDTS